MTKDSQIIVAMDYPNMVAATNVADQLRGKVKFKAGLQLCTSAGLPHVINGFGNNIFLDLKFHDIPNTVHGAVLAAASHQVWMLNVHCLGGKEMMQAARQAADEVFARTKNYRPLIIGVTILTSQDRASLDAIGIDPMLPMNVIVARLAIMAAESGLDGVVCSPQEIKTVRQVVCDEGFTIVTPGIRRKDAPADDQKRTATAREAVDLGATYPVIGRPITQAADPVAAAEEFIDEIS